MFESCGLGCAFLWAISSFIIRIQTVFMTLASSSRDYSAL
jgi:hypothetical protein